MATAIFNHAITAAHSLRGNAATQTDGSGGANGAGGTNSGSSGSATISANDFLTLLVTEMQNQDPTAQTDPNEYINQLVNVNSLEQLIDINQTLDTGLGVTQGNSSSVAPGQSAKTFSSAHDHAGPGDPTVTRVPGHIPGIPAPAAGTTVPVAPGNLGVPAANGASQRVAHALDGQTHSPRAAIHIPAGR